ncbi:FkbM family methyltransferase [Desulfovibrio legallii]|uniref:FkbM family methyltransferase n=1 Tax=Desulfovibrio legallii TaxID=571438 RepID=A0A6H3F6G2_9BACT|nr:FkbM family methyltransferase [Desulfovibrio legallii]TBH78388.1 FkbM family methyltransferase [Desulfovibrio legallii]
MQDESINAALVKELFAVIGELKRQFERIEKNQSVIVDYLSDRGMARYDLSCDIPNIERLLQLGTRFPHPHGIVISKHARLGPGCMIWQNVTIGAKQLVEDGGQNMYPNIGSNVKIYAGACIIGDVKVGDFSIIDCNAVVLNDIPPYTVVAGVPAKKIGINESVLRKGIESNKRFEEKIYKKFQKSTLVKSLSPSSVCIDCGANKGDVTEIFANTGASVIAFEPHPICYRALKKRFSHNENVKIFNKGVFIKNDRMKLFISNVEEYDPLAISQSSSLYRTKTNIDSAKYHDVEVIDITDFIFSIDKKISILKLDVEGAEYCILEKIIISGALNKIETVLVETHEDRIPEICEEAIRVRKLIKDMNITSIHLDWV